MRTIDGSNPNAATQPSFNLITSGSGTYSSPSGCTYVIVEIVGGGGGGGKNTGSSTGGSGGAGAYQKIKYSAGSYTYSVGTGGSGTTVSGDPGIAGGDTTFASRISRGGNPGLGTGRGGNGGVTAGSGGTVLVDVAGQCGQVFNGSGFSNLGGSNPFGFANNASASGNTPTIHAGARGVGGGGVDTFTTSSGSGSGGCILITEFY